MKETKVKRAKDTSQRNGNTTYNAFRDDEGAGWLIKMKSAFCIFHRGVTPKGFKVGKLAHHTHTHRM